MKFVQFIEFKTDDIDAFSAEVDRWIADSTEFRTATRASLCADRDDPGTYVHIVEFPSYEEAMTNSNDPRTADFAARMATMTAEGRRFRNLDLLRVNEL
jgi:quinol monooxygenase YgiN